MQSKETTSEFRKGHSHSVNDEPSFFISEKKYNLQISPVLEKLSKTELSNVQEIVASQLSLMTQYHNLVLDQANRSFRWALIAAGIGLFFFILSVCFFVYFEPKDAGLVSLICGALVEFIAGVNFYLYNKASNQVAHFQAGLDKTQRYLLANSICEGMEGADKQKARAALIEKISLG